MYCSYCRLGRPDNAAPCPECGAPSSLLEQSPAASWAVPVSVPPMWSGPPTVVPNEQWNNQVPYYSPDMSPAVPSWQQEASFQQQAMPQQQGGWSPYGADEVQGPSGGPQSLLPVPYQEPAQAGYQQNQMQLMAMQAREQMLPALPYEQDAQASIYVPPIYTKPRPIIPPYRVISGFLSILIVSLLLCSGSIYYAKTSGKLDGMMQFFGVALPPSMNAPAPPNIPDPPDKVDRGPAINIITAAATTSHVDPNNFTPRQSDQIFQVGAPFYVTYSARPPKPGNIIIKWYMNNQHYLDTVNDKLIDPKVQPAINGDAKMVYVTPAEGMVELYWSDQSGKETLAQRLYFAVR